MKNIVLLGYMGSGKTSVGQCLSDVLKWDFIDLDKYIEQVENLTIEQIFNQKGVVYFRKLEHEMLKRVIQSSENVVFSLGGGTPVYFNNMDLIKSNENFTSVYLNTGIDQLAINLFENRKSRPLISHLDSMDQLKEFIAKHLFERRQEYFKAQNHIITDGKTVQDITKEVIALLF